MNISRNVKASSPVKKSDTEVIKPLFDINTLDFYCRYIVSANQNIRVSGLNLVKELFSRVDPSSYGNDIERVKRIEFIKRGLDARLVKKLTNRDMIIQYINGGILDEPLLDTNSMEEISDEVLAYLNEQAGELVKSYFVDGSYEKILQLSTDLKNANYSRRSEVVHQIQSLVAELNMQFNKMDDAAYSTPMFTLVPGEFETAMSDIHARETSPSRILRTGMTGLNIMLDGGFQASRVYIIFAQAAGGKSFTMLDLAMQIKKYNKDYIPHDPTKIPTILFLTMENSEDENVSRMMNMASGKNLSDCSLDDSIQAFRMNGLGFSETDLIDIVMVYKPNLSINTDYLYTLVDKLRELGRETICVFQDHIKRIRPVNKRNDLRLDLGEIVNEFKAFANATGIPVITDSHLNREASRTLDDSSQNNKKDLIRSLGSFNVSESYLMIDNCDFGVIINKEMDSNENMYMGFKVIKTRTKCDLELMYQPYVPENPVKLVEDIELVAPAFRRSLKDENQPISRVSRRNDFNNMSQGSKHAVDDDELFGAEVMGVVSQSVDDILLPDNANQSSFIVVGSPSKPILPMPTSPISPIKEDIDGSLTAWEKELVAMKYNSNAKTAIVFFDENGLAISDGVEDFVS